MVGTHRVVVKSPRAEYSIEIKRKFTILSGNSGTGKTRLNSMILESETSPLIKVYGTVEVVVVMQYKSLLSDLNHNKRCIYLIDEHIASLLDNPIFARLAKNADGYFIIITRKALANIPYSASEIYDFTSKTVGKKTVYTQVRRYNWEDAISVNAEYLLVEDSVVGYEFYKRTCTGIVESANGNSNIEKKLLSLEKSRYNHIFVVADGAAFGSQISKYMDVLSKSKKDIRLFCPESFEYLVLRSGIVRVDSDTLENTQDYAETTKYFSWERYYTD